MTISCKCLACIISLGLVILCSGCVTNMFPGGPSTCGIIYTEVTSPAQNLSVATDTLAESNIQGESSSMGFLGLFAFGNSGVHAAMKDGGITKVHHVDHKVQHFLYGIYAKQTTIVYGE